MAAVLFIIFFLYCSFMLNFLEKSFTGDFEPDWDKDSINNSLWLTTVTMTSVGYGDGFPATHLGRVYMMIACI